MRKFLLNVLVSVVVMSLPVTAQNVSLPYQMNFEENESAELNNWNLNPGANAPALLDQWVVGKSVHSAGRQALYISNNGRDAQFDSVPGVQYAYRDMVLPAGTCILTFDWLCIGAPTSALYVGIGDLTGLTLEARTIGTLPNTIANPVLTSMLFSNLKDQETWKNESYTFTSDGVSTTRLVFAWASNNRDKSASTIGACIDNIIITNTNCPRPSDIMAEAIGCDSAYVTWTGNSQSYEVNYRQVGTTNWIQETRTMMNPNDYTKSSAYLTNLTEGSYEVRVRGICTPDTSAWTYGPEFVLFCPDLHCVNFTDLHASTVTCTYGRTGYGNGYNDLANRNKAYETIGVVDFGSESVESRHTVNWDKTATDPRTGGMLSLIPKGGYASVRLGNWSTSNGAESITYEYVVDSSNAVVLMQYAVVLEDPGHGPEDQPRFVLEILDAHNNLIEPTCGVRNFAADQTMAGWHTYGSGYDLVTWKDWTTVGLNTRELGIQDGEVIRVRLTTYDCFQGGHYGYAYFTLDCAKATIDATACAKNADVAMALKAPEGFRYQWYDKYDNALVGQTSRIYEPEDTATYRCRVISTENSSCYFDLYSAAIPRLPAPEFSWKDSIAECQHVVDFINTSHTLIVQKYDTIVDRSEGCNENLWVVSGTLTDGTSFGPVQSSAIAPLVRIPAQGGTFSVSLSAGLAGGCDSTLVQRMVLPDVTIKPDTVHTMLCRPVNDPAGRAWYDALGVWVEESSFIPQTFTAKNGCDSVIVHDVKLGNSYNVKLGDTTLCYGEKLLVGKTLYDSRTQKSGQWADFSLKTTLGCDSVVYYNVRVADAIKPVLSVNGEVLEQPYALVYLEDGEVSVDIAVGGTGFDSYTVSYNDATGQKTDIYTPADVLLRDIPVNEYIFTFANADGCELVDTVLVGGDTLCVDLLSQIQCACGKPVLDIPFRKCQPVNKARMASCTVKFSDADKAEQGFADAFFTGLHDADTIHIDVPAGAEPGEYQIDLIFDTIIGGCIWGQNAFHTTIKLTYDSSVIFHRWTNNAIISLAGPQVAKKADGSDYGLYAFSDFQWLRNGEVVEGEQLSYMEQPGVLNPSDRFALRMTRSDGQVFTTCDYVPGHNGAMAKGSAPKASIAPSDPMSGEPVSLNVSEDAEVEIYTLMGNKVFAGEFEKGVSSFRAPTAQGIYIMNVRMRGDAQTLRFRVR